MLLEYVNVFDLLFWFIFVNRKELVEICWLRGNNYLCKFECLI